MIDHEQMIIVLDFGAQYSQLIARRVRECHVYSQILPFNTPVEQIRALRPDGIIFSGGPASVRAEGSPRPEQGILELGIPVLGICYGLQVLSVMLGGSVDDRNAGNTDMQRWRRSVRVPCSARSLPEHICG